MLGILAAVLATFLVNLKAGDPLINGITIGLAVYLITYYVLKWRFLNKVEKPTKILTMGIGAYFLTFLMCWVFFVTTLLAPPTATFTINAPNPVVGEIIEFDASGSEDVDGDIVKYIWDFGDENTSEGINSSHIFNSSGEFIVRLTVVDEHGISSTNTTTLTVNAGT